MIELIAGSDQENRGGLGLNIVKRGLTQSINRETTRPGYILHVEFTKARSKS